MKKREWKILLKQGEEGERGENVRKQSLAENRVKQHISRKRRGEQETELKR